MDSFFQVTAPYVISGKLLNLLSQFPHQSNGSENKDVPGRVVERRNWVYTQEALVRVIPLIKENMGRTQILVSTWGYSEGPCVYICLTYDLEFVFLSFFLTLQAHLYLCMKLNVSTWTTTLLLIKFNKILEIISLLVFEVTNLESGIYFPVMLQLIKTFIKHLF